MCGKSAHVAVGVKEGIRPAYEALHVVQSVEAGVRDIPSLLEGLAPPSKEWANLGTQEYGKKSQQSSLEVDTTMRTLNGYERLGRGKAVYRGCVTI
ncbi:hypothetical protein N7471_001065 [Penicillium samsonianum]|uniref:uncharacterized protein n=1 Tax=Penicillium samsonianum TaxID=1882272 RepID=UPI0025476998|nr:uncharacterized protein N7471_001065 [Penicillium samsonianum]KAJ6149866.1 hypothetical protein N7471_001065 [Penicillium samsonianum]